MTTKEKVKFLEELDKRYDKEAENVKKQIEQGLIKQYKKNENPYSKI
jgi:hypothetical protein